MTDPSGDQMHGFIDQPGWPLSQDEDFCNPQMDVIMLQSGMLSRFEIYSLPNMRNLGEIADLLRYNGAADFEFVKGWSKISEDRLRERR